MALLIYLGPILRGWERLKWRLREMRAAGKRRARSASRSQKPRLALAGARLLSLLLEREGRREGGAAGRAHALPGAAEIFRRQPIRAGTSGISRSRAACGAGRSSWSAPRITAASKHLLRVRCAMRLSRFCGLRAARLCAWSTAAALILDAPVPRGDRRRHRPRARRPHRATAPSSSAGSCTASSRRWRSARRWRRCSRPAAATQRAACAAPLGTALNARRWASRWKLLPYLRPYRLRFAWALVQVFLIAGFELLKPWPLQLVIDDVLGGKPALALARRDCRRRRCCSPPASGWS